MEGPWDFQSQLVQTMDLYNWSEIVEKILNGNPDEDFARKIMEQIIQAASLPDIHYDFEQYASKILAIVLDKYFDSTWDILGSAILNSNFLFFLHIKNMVGGKNGGMEENGILFEREERNEKLFEWCKKHSPKAAIRIANFMPLGVQQDKGLSWHPFTKRIIDEFGNDERVLSELSANMGTYSSSDSSIPYLSRLTDLAGLLKNHPIEMVRKWAISKVQSLNKEIRLENLSNEEDQLE
jgi:hypothetical protein